MGCGRVLCYVMLMCTIWFDFGTTRSPNVLLLCGMVLYCFQFIFYRTSFLPSSFQSWVLCGASGVFFLLLFLG